MNLISITDQGRKENPLQNIGEAFLRDYETRFWKRVYKDGPISEDCPELGRCWIWTGPVWSNGYGKYSRSRRALGGRSQVAHEIAYVFLHGAIPAGKFLVQQCKNQLCVRDEHLALEPIFVEED